MLATLPPNLVPRASWWERIPIRCRAAVRDQSYPPAESDKADDVQGRCLSIRRTLQVLYRRDEETFV